MNDKEIIEEMAKDLATAWLSWSKTPNNSWYEYVATILRTRWQPKLPEDSVVLTEEDYIKLITAQADVLRLRNVTVADLRKETAKDVAFALESQLADNDNDDNFTKTEILNMVKDLLKDYFGVDIKE